MSTAKGVRHQVVQYEEVPIAGKAIRLEHAHIPVESLELDPDNPRIRYRLGIKPGTDAHQELLGWRDVQLLRKDIERSGGLRERIVVQYDADSRKYTVREGNCRTVCYTSLNQKSPDDPRWQKVPARVLPEDVDPRAVAILLADWQVVGKIEWKAHEKAAQIYYMHRNLKMSMDEIAMHMRASKTTIQRQLDAHRALTERFFTIDDGKYVAEGEGKWSFFEEFFKSKELREHLKGTPELLDDFCRWVGEGRLKQGVDVRILARVLANTGAADQLRHGDVRTALSDAKNLLAQSDPSIDSDFFKLLARLRDLLTSAAQVREILRIRNDDVAREQIVKTYADLVDFMRLANLDPQPTRKTKKPTKKRARTTAASRRRPVAKTRRVRR